MVGDDVMRIGEPTFYYKDDEVFYQVAVEGRSGTSVLWYSIQKEFEPLLCQSSDGPLVALLIPAMMTGEDIYLEGSVSEKLWHNLSGPFQRLLCHIMPWLSTIKITPCSLTAEKKVAPGVITGFSGGIDSYCTLADHYFSEVTPGFKISHLLFNNVGSHGKKDGEKLFHQRYSALKPTVDRIGLPFLRVNSNIHEFYGKKINFKQTHSLRNASVALLLQGGVGRFMYSSGHSFNNTYIGPSNDTACSDPVLLPYLSTERMDTMLVGGEYSRVEKTNKISDLSITHDTVDVCVRGDGAGNCSTCKKCLRTLSTLDVGGNLEAYARSFDLKAYNKSRAKFFGKILSSKEPLLREIYQFAKEENFSFPPMSHLYAQYWRIKNVVKWPSATLKRMINKKV